MSAWDIAGAVVWTPLTLWQLVTLLTLKHSDVDPSPPRTLTGAERSVGLICTCLTATLAVFCIARLCGAHA